MHKNPNYNIVQAPGNCNPLFVVIYGQRTDSGHMSPGAVVMTVPLSREKAIEKADEMQATYDSVGNGFNVTFYSSLAGRRGTLIENVTEEQADAVVARFSDKSNMFEYLPEVRKEAA
jgi:hypothetical protein